MKTFKNSLTVIICGIFTASAPLNSAACAVQTGKISDALKKSGNLKTHYMYQPNSSATAAAKNKAIYDMYVKVDSEKFFFNEEPKIYQETSEIITDVAAWIDNGDGSYVTADIIDFEPAQLDHLNLSFPVNGDYYCYVYASTDVTADFIISVKTVKSPYDPSDKTPPELDIYIPDASDYVEGKDIYINIQANELCNIEICGKNHYMCNGLNFPISSDGVYTVNAVDINGNYTSSTFTVDIISKATTPTDPPPATSLYGDSNMDGQVTLSDAAAVFQSIGNPDKYALSPQAALNADCYNPGSGVTVRDAITIQQFQSRVISSLPVMQ